MIDEALREHLGDGDPKPKTCFADDLVLKLLTFLNAKRALGACGQWEDETGQVFTAAIGKSASLAREGDPVDIGLHVNGKPILQARTFEYLGVTLGATGPTPASLNRRVKSASAALTSQRALHLLVRGMNLRQTTFIYDTFVVSRWTYAVFLQPCDKSTDASLQALDARFISTVLVPCRVEGPARRRSLLPILRAILRLPSPQLRRQLMAHRYVTQLHRLQLNTRKLELARERARDALAVIDRVPGFSALVPDKTAPWVRQNQQLALKAEWHNATAHAKRSVPDPGSRRHWYPPAARLADDWARALAARYHCNTFPILHRSLRRQGPPDKNAKRPQPINDAAVLTPAEKLALTALQLLHHAEATTQHLRDITAALRTLRPRETWAREDWSRPVHT